MPIPSKYRGRELSYNYKTWSGTAEAVYTDDFFFSIEGEKDAYNYLAIPVTRQEANNAFTGISALAGLFRDYKRFYSGVSNWKELIDVATVTMEEGNDLYYEYMDAIREDRAVDFNIPVSAFPYFPLFLVFFFNNVFASPFCHGTDYSSINGPRTFLKQFNGDSLIRLVEFSSTLKKNPIWFYNYIRTYGDYLKNFTDRESIYKFIDSYKADINAEKIINADEIIMKEKKING